MIYGWKKLILKLHELLMLNKLTLHLQNKIKNIENIHYSKSVNNEIINKKKS